MGDRKQRHIKMLRLLVLVAAASAYPQYFNPYMMAPYPLHYAPVAPPAPQVYTPEVYAPVAARSEPLPDQLEDQLEMLEDVKEARYLINFEAFQRVSAAFVATATPALTVTGVASFYQNPFTGQNSKYKITLNGLTTGSSYYIGLGTTSDCVSVTGEVALKTGTAPAIILFDTVKAYGTLDTHNIDGAGGKTMLTGLSVVVRSGTVKTDPLIGCTSANLA